MHHTNNHRAKHAVYKASRSFGSLLKCPSLLILPSILKMLCLETVEDQNTEEASTS